MTTSSGETTQLHFSHYGREAAQHLLKHTALGEAVQTFGRTGDEDGILRVWLPDDAPLSSGERQLWHFLASLAGWGSVNLRTVLQTVDSDTALAVAWSLGMASGHFSASSPVTFGGVL